MKTQLDLFERAATLPQPTDKNTPCTTPRAALGVPGDVVYPESPGFKERGGTSEAAAKATKTRAGMLRWRVEETLRGAGFGGLTADECAGAIGATEFSTRPRFSELFAMGKIEKTGERRKNASGHAAAVWRLVRFN